MGLQWRPASSRWARVAPFPPPEPLHTVALCSRSAKSDPKLPEFPPLSAMGVRPPAALPADSLPARSARVGGRPLGARPHLQGDHKRGPSLCKHEAGPQTAVGALHWACTAADCLRRSRAKQLARAPNAVAQCGPMQANKQQSPFSH